MRPLDHALLHSAEEVGALHGLGSAVPSFGLIDPRALGPVDEILWTELVLRCGDGNPFACPWFLLPSLSAFDPGHSVRLAVVRSDLGEWIGALPVQPVRRHGRLPLPHWQAWHHANLFTGGPLVVPGQERRFWHETLRGLAGQRRGAGLLRINDLPLDTAAAAALLDMAGEGALNIHRERLFSRAMLRVGDGGHNGSSYAPDPRQRRRLCSLERRMAAELGPVRLEFARGMEAVAPVLAAFLSLEAAGWKGRTGSSVASCAAKHAFFCEVIANASARGQLEAASLHAGDHLVALSLYFIDGSTGAGFKTTFDEAHARHAPGVVLLHRLSQALVQRGVTTFDSCSAPDQQPISRMWPGRRAMMHCSIALPGLRGALETGLLKAGDRLRGRPQA